jgi:hypothetical protein
MSLTKPPVITPEKLVANPAKARQSRAPATPEGLERVREANLLPIHRLLRVAEYRDFAAQRQLEGNRPAKISRMKVSPTMFMKTKGRAKRAWESPTMLMKTNNLLA